MSGYKTHRFSQEPDDYEGPWPEEKVVKPTVDEVMVQAEPVAWMKFGGAVVHAITRNAMGPVEAVQFDIPLYTHPAPAAPQQAEPVAQIGWADEFGNLFPMGAWKPSQRTYHDSHKMAWRPVFLHPPAAEVQRLRDAAKKVIDAYAELYTCPEEIIDLRRALEGK